MPGLTSRLSHCASSAGWMLSSSINRVLPQGVLPAPTWAPGALLRKCQRTPMQTGVPRKTLSLCPECNRHAVEAVISGRSNVASFREHPGMIEAEILEEGSRVLMRKVCEMHGPYEDVLSNHPDFFRRMEGLSFGADFACLGDQEVHNHGPNSIQAGRGTFLIVDLTNRCNMMCRPCFMNANGVGHVDEIDMEDVKRIFERAGSFKPRREINVLFSGGEPTLSPILVDAIRHAKSMGFHRLHISTNGIRLAEERDFALDLSAAGLHAVYLQFDGVSEEKNRHRGLGNYMEVKLRALENIAAAGMHTTLQVTVVNGVNNDCVGEIIRFALKHTDQIHGVVFQPIMFTGRDEGISSERRYAERYPLSQLAYDLQSQSAIEWEPMRDWFPASAYAIFGHLSDVLDPSSERGSVFYDIHPDHAIMSALLVDIEKEKAIPITSFFNLGQFMQDVVEITDSARSPRVTKTLVLLSLLRNFNRAKAPSGFGPRELSTVFNGSCYRVTRSDHDWPRRASVKKSGWKLMIVHGMWFQDAYNYDFATIANSSIPVATLEGEISFAAYNGGGWRKVLEATRPTTSSPEWYREHGRHQIYARGRNVDFGAGADCDPERLVRIEAVGKSTS